MAVPSINDLIRYINRKLTGANWNTNLQTIVNWFSDGNTDLNINSLTVANDVTVGGDLDVTGDVTADEFIGDGSQLTGLNEWRKNFVINGTCLIKNNADYTLVKDVYGESVDRFEGMATGTAVSAGTLTQTTAANCGDTGYALKFSGVTITDTGIIYLRHRLYNRDAVNFKDKVGSFATQVYHDVGSQANYTIYFNKADALNDFSSVTAINDSGALGVASSTATQIKYENVSLGDCSNGLEIEIKVECGAITLKNFEFAELQLEQAANIAEFEFKNFETDVAADSFEGATGALKEIVDTAQLIDGAVDANKMGDGASYENTQTRYYSVSGAQWTRTTTASTYDDSLIQKMNSGTADTLPDFYDKDINLPHGATITALKMYFYKEAPANVNDSVSIDLYKFAIGENTQNPTQTINLATTTETGNTSKEITGQSMVIDNLNYKYGFRLTISTNTNVDHAYFVGAVITYTVDNPLP